jgi:hypothetical protein
MYFYFSTIQNTNSQKLRSIVILKNRSLLCGGSFTSGFKGTSKFTTFKSLDCIRLFNLYDTTIVEVDDLEQKSPAKKWYFFPLQVFPLQVRLKTAFSMYHNYNMLSYY